MTSQDQYPGEKSLHNQSSSAQNKGRMVEINLILAETRLQILKAKTESEIHAALGHCIYSMLQPSGIVGVAALDEKSQEFRASVILGISGPLQEYFSENHLNFDHFSFPAHEIKEVWYKQYKSGQLERFSGSYFDIFGERIPREVCQKIEEITGAKFLYILGLNWDQTCYGLIVLIANHELEIFAGVIETMVSLAAQSIKNLRSENIIKTDQERFQNIFENSPIAFCEEDFSETALLIDELRKRGVVDLHSYLQEHPSEFLRITKSIKFLNMNRAAFHVLHASTTEEIAAHFYELLKGDGSGFLMDAVISVVEDKKEFTWEGNASTTQGEPIILHINWSFLPDEESEYKRILISFEDVTEKRQADTRLRESERQLSTLISNLPGMVYRCLDDEKWTILFVNEGCEKVTGYTPEEFLGQKVSYSDLVVQDDLPKIREIVERNNSQMRPFQAIYRIHTKSGEVRWVWEQGSSYQSSDGRVILEGFIADISQRMLAEQSTSLINQFQSQLAQTYDPLAIIQLTCNKIQEIAEEVCVFALLNEPDHGIYLHSLEQCGFSELLRENQQIISQSIYASWNDFFPSDHLAQLPAAQERKLQKIIFTKQKPAFDPSAFSNIYSISLINTQLKFGGLLIFARAELSNYRFKTIETLVHLAAISIDRLYSERSLAMSEERFRRVFVESPIGISLSGKNHCFYKVNQRFAEIMGYSIEELQGMSFRDITYINDLAQNEDLIAKLEKGEIPYFSIQKRYIRKDQTIVWANVTVTVIRSDKGEFHSFLAMVEDITEQKVAEEVLLHEQHLFQTLMDNVPVSVYFKDLQGRFIRANRNTLQKFGLTSENQLIGKSDADFFTPDNVDETLIEENEIIKTGHPVINQEEIEIWSGDQANTWVSVTKMPYYDQSGKIIGTFGVVQDITDRKKREEEIKQLNAELEKRVEQRTKELKLRNQELETFTYTISHDLKAPLRGITGYSQLLLQEHANQLDEEGTSFLHKLILSSEQLAELIDDLLEYSRLERRPINHTTISIKEILAAVIDERYPDVHRMGITLHTNLDEETINSSPELMMQIFRNYLDNAIKFSSKSAHPEIWVEYKINGDRSLLTVRDNGIGFDMKFAEKIFDVFFRINKLEDYPGTGIGLALVKRTANLLGYRVWAESAPESGASFFLEINHKQDQP